MANWYDAPIPIKALTPLLEVASGVILLGGDILDADGKYARKNWHYEPHFLLSPAENSRRSIEKAKAYAADFMEKYGTDYSVQLVVYEG